MTGTPVNFDLRRAVQITNGGEAPLAAQRVWVRVRIAFCLTICVVALVLLPGLAHAGLDLMPLGKAKPGHEAEWEQLMEIVYEGGRHSDLQVKRLNEISNEPSGSGEGLPRYTHAGMYSSGVDAASFRGSFLSDCEALLGRELLERAWTYMMRPADAVKYGNELLAIADRAANGQLRPAFEQKKKVWVGGGEPVRESTITMDEQIDILRAAGHWYIYWGERGHSIHAWW